jgi:hypothetical protein
MSPTPAPPTAEPKGCGRRDAVRGAAMPAANVTERSV